MLPAGQTPQASCHASGGAVGGYIALLSQGTTATRSAHSRSGSQRHDYGTGRFFVNLARSEPTVSFAPGEAWLSAFVSGFTVPD